MKVDAISCVLISLGLNVVSGLFLKRSIISFNANEDDWEVEHLSKECKAELKNSLTCLQKIESGINSKEDYFVEDLNINEVCLPYEDNTKANLDTCKKQIASGYDTICKVFEDDSCKDLLAENSVVNLINNSKCNNNDYDIYLLSEIAAVKSVYLMGCNKAKSGDLCPLAKYVTTTAVDYIYNNFKTIYRFLEQEYGDTNNEIDLGLSLGNDALTLLPIFKELNNILIDTCKNENCSKNIVAIDNMILAAKAAYEKKQNVDLTKKFPRVFQLYDSYFSNFRKQKCKLITFVNEEDASGASTTKKITYSFAAVVVASVLLLL